MKRIDVKDNTYIDFKKEVHDKNPEFKVGDHARTSKSKNIFANGYTPNWSEEIFIKKIKNTVPWTHGHMLLMILMVKKLLIRFMKMNCKAQVKKNSEQKKYLRKKVISYK